MDLKAQIARDLRHEFAANQCLLEPEELPECRQRFEQYTQWILYQRPWLTELKRFASFERA